MAITFPRTDVMSYCNFQPAAVPLRLHRRQEFSSTAGGTIISKDLGPAIWVGSFVTEPLDIIDMVEFEAILRSLDGGIRKFEAGDLRRKYPVAHRDGNFNDVATLFAVQAGGGAIRLDGCDAGFTITRGDYFEFDHPDGSRALHQAMETVVASGAGVTGYFEVRPQIREEGLTLTPPVEVRFKQPMGLFILVPSTVSSEMLGGVNGIIKFGAVQAVT